MVRALLIELVTPGRFHCGQGFPFVHGLLSGDDANDWSSRWLRFGVDPAVQLKRDEHGVGLNDEDLDTLCVALREPPATHVLLSHHPAESLVQAIRAAAPGAALAVLDAPASGGSVPALPVLAPLESAVRAWLCASAAPSKDESSDRLVAVSHPDYGFEVANEAAREMAPFLFILAGAGCTYRRPLKKSAFFAARSDPSLPERWGCSFCHEAGGGDVSEKARRTDGLSDPMELLGNQLHGIARSYRRGATPLRLRVLSAAVTSSPAAFVRLVSAVQLPPVRFLVDYRADFIARRHAALKEALRLLGEMGHSLDICLVGVESFSAVQLDRYHKGFGPEAILEALRVLRALEREFPTNFGFREYGGLSTILYDPWARLADVALNLAVVDHFRLEELCGKLLTSRLRLNEGLPLTRIARAEGLLREAYEDPLLDTARRNFYPDDLPWRFKDPRLEALNQLTTRLPYDPQLESDRLYSRLASWGRASGLSEIARAARLCASAAASSVALSPDELLARASSAEPVEAEKRASAPPASATVAADFFDFSWEYALFAAGRKPVIKVEDGVPPEAQREIEADLRRRHPGITVRFRTRGWDGGETSELFAGLRAAEVDEAVELTELREHETDPALIQEALSRTGVLLGYPACCASAYATSPHSLLTSNEWLRVERRVEHMAPVEPELHPLATNYVPCRLDCRATLEIARLLAATRGRSEPASLFEMPTLLLLNRPGEFATLEPLGPVVEEIPGVTYRLPYRCLQVKTADSRREALISGDTLVIEPGLVIVLAGERELAHFALDAFLWWTERVFHREFWRACVRELAAPPEGGDPQASRARAPVHHATHDEAPAAEPDEAAAASSEAPSRPSEAAEAGRLVLGRVLRLMAARRPALLQGFKVVALEVRERTASEELVVTLSKGTRSLEVCLFPLSSMSQPAFLRGKRYGLAYSSATPLSGEGDERLLGVILAAFERHLR